MMMGKSGISTRNGLVAAAGWMMLCVIAAGCTSTPVDDTPAYTATMAKPIAADEYPVIEGARMAATTQMSNEDAASQQARLTALGSARSSGRISEATYRRRLAELRALAENHGADTLKEIKN